LSTILKDGTVYYFVNDGLQYVSSGWAGLADVEAIPTISVQDARVEVTGFDLKTDVTFIDNYLAGSEGKLLVADPANTIVSADSKTVTFNNISDIINLKDRRAFSAGDALVFPANESARIEFDYKVDSYGNDADSYVFAFNMRFRDGNGTDCRSVYFKNSAIGNNSWNWNDSPSQAIQGTEFPLEELEVGQTVHVVITRVISDRTHILVKVGNSAPFETVNSSNVGTFYLSFSCSGGNATVSNISAVSQVPLINTTPSATHPYANKFNYSALGEGKLSVNADEALAEAAFDYQGKFFYAEATFKTLESFWVWDQVSIHAKPLTALSGISQRSWGVAFGDGSKKAIGEELVGSAIQWGQFTDRTQVWGQGGIQNLDATNYKLTTVLKEGKVYYFVDDILQYVDASWAGLGGVDAIPTISVQRAKVEVTNITLSTSMTVINDYLAGNEGKLLAALAGSTTVSADSKTINFIGNTNGWPFDNVKDRRAYSAGEALVFPANAPSASIEFDYKIDAYGNDEDAYRFAFTMQRTEGLVKECRSVLLSNYETGMEAWGWDGGSGLGFNWGHTSVGDLEVGKTYHIVITRVLTSEGANGDGLMNNYAISIDGVPYTLTGHDNYSGTYTLSFAVLKGNATISNISAVA
ncbi:MAG: hypothetical protein LBM99_02175, partial [Bacillales bacterium]|nr:hypothetical protein [Bacillales bacterium]